MSVERFVREVGKTWHVAQNETQAACSVSFDPLWHPDKDVQRSNKLPDTDNRCTRKGCREMFGIMQS